MPGHYPARGAPCPLLRHSARTQTAPDSAALATDEVLDGNPDKNYEGSIDRVPDARAAQTVTGQPTSAVASVEFEPVLETA